MTKAHEKFEFGTFEDRLAHACAVVGEDCLAFSVDDEGDVVPTDEALAWANKHGVCLNWLLIGNPSILVTNFAKGRKQEAEFAEKAAQMEPEVRAGFAALMMAVVVYGLPFQQALSDFEEILREHRS